MNEINYTLQTTFDYAFKGEQRTAEFITLKAPTVDNIGYVGAMKQGFMHAVAEQQSKVDITAETTVDAGDVDGLDGSMIMSMLAMSKIDYAKFLMTAKAAFTAKGVALIDGEQPITQPLADKMSLEDLERMTGEYLKVFILPSALGTV